MKSLFSECIEINSIEDIDKAIEKVINSQKEEFEIEIKNIEAIVFRFIGRRFDNEYIPIKTAEISVIYKSNFVKYYNNLLHTKIDEDVLFFDIKRGSFEIDFQQILSDIVGKGIKKMNGAQITLVIIFAIGAWFAKTSFDDYLNAQKNKYTQEITTKALEVLEKNIELKNAKNKPVNKALEILEDDEKLEYGNIKDKTIYTKEDVEKFDTTNEEHIKYETIEGNFYVKELRDKDGRKIVTLKRGKQKKFDAISKLDNNAHLYEAFDTQQIIRLKIKIGKNSQGDIVEADIYEVLK